MLTIVLIVSLTGMLGVDSSPLDKTAHRELLEYLLKRTEETCTYKEKTLKVGESYPADGSCPFCTCHEGGHLACSMCAPPPEVVVQTCTYHGHTLKVGESYPADGSCPSCTCHKGGRLACSMCASTTVRCYHGGNMYDEGESWLSFVPGGGCQSCTCTHDLGELCESTECPTQK